MFTCLPPFFLSGGIHLVHTKLAKVKVTSIIHTVHGQFGRIPIPEIGTFRISLSQISGFFPSSKVCSEKRCAVYSFSWVACPCRIRVGICGISTLCTCNQQNIFYKFGSLLSCCWPQSPYVLGYANISSPTFQTSLTQCSGESTKHHKALCFTEILKYKKKNIYIYNVNISHDYRFSTSNVRINPPIYIYIHRTCTILYNHIQ